MTLAAFQEEFSFKFLSETVTVMIEKGQSVDLSECCNEFLTVDPHRKGTYGPKVIVLVYIVSNLQTLTAHLLSNKCAVRV